MFALQEHYANKLDVSLFAFGSHNKKRPDNAVFARMFNKHVLDMFELGVHDYIPTEAFHVRMWYIRPDLHY